MQAVYSTALINSQSSTFATAVPLYAYDLQSTILGARICLAVSAKLAKIFRHLTASDTLFRVGHLMRPIAVPIGEIPGVWDCCSSNR